MQFPVIVITVGHVSKDHVYLFAAANEHGEIMLPLFTNLVLAEKYKRRCMEAARRITLEISITGSAYASLNLQLYVVHEAARLSDIVKVAAVCTPVTYITVDPDSDSDKVLCLEFDEFMSELTPDNEPSNEV